MFVEYLVPRDTGLGEGRKFYVVRWKIKGKGHDTLRMGQAREPWTEYSKIKQKETKHNRIEIRTKAKRSVCSKTNAHFESEE